MNNAGLLNKHSYIDKMLSSDVYVHKGPIVQDQLDLCKAGMDD